MNILGPIIGWFLVALLVLTEGFLFWLLWDAVRGHREFKRKMR